MSVSATDFDLIGVLRKKYPNLTEPKIEQLAREAYVDYRTDDKMYKSVYHLSGLFVLEAKWMSGLTFKPQLARKNLLDNEVLVTSASQPFAHSGYYFESGLLQNQDVFGEAAMQFLLARGMEAPLTAQQLSLIKHQLSQSGHNKHHILYYYTQSGDFTRSITGLSRKMKKELYGTESEETPPVCDAD